MKQVIIMRKFKKGMRTGKYIAQGAHASMKATLENMDRPETKEWLDSIFKKVVVYVKTEEELIDLYLQALQKGLITAKIEDSGLTEFKGVKTLTAVAVGPGKPEDIDEVTGHLKLF